MDLSQANISLNRLTLRRHVIAYLDFQMSGGIEQQPVLELVVPFQVAEDVATVNLAHLERTLDDCAEMIARNMRIHKSEHGDFRMDWMQTRTHPAAFARVAELTRKYIQALSFGLDDSDGLASFAIGDGLPRQHAVIRSTGMFGISARVPYGQVNLEITYPDRLTQNEGKRPIDEIDTFLTVGLSRIRMQSSAAQDDREVFQRDNPNMPLPEDLCTVEFSAPDYHPLSGYKFRGSHLTLIADSIRPPCFLDVRPVVVEFRRLLLEELPHLAR